MYIYQGEREREEKEKRWAEVLWQVLILDWL